MKKQIKRLFRKSKALKMLKDPPSQLQELHFSDNEEEDEMPEYADNHFSSSYNFVEIEFSKLSPDQSARHMLNYQQ